MRLRLLPLLVAALALLAAPAVASAKVIVGIGENNAAIFQDPLFQQLGAKHVRVVMPYDVMTAKDAATAYARSQAEAYLRAARAARVEPLVTFEHHAGDANICNRRRNLKKAVCALPSAKKYERNVKAFFKAFPWVKVVSPWNEINHYTQPTSRNPRAAARFTDIVARACKKCKVMAAEVLDQADRVSAKRPTFNRTLSFIRKYRQALRTKRTICGIHNYSDVNRFRTIGTATLIKALGCRQIWLTETGGVYHFTNFWSKATEKGCKTAAACQLKATKYVFSTARKQKSIKRIYIYTWFGGTTQRWDSGLVAGGQARPAYREVRKHV